MTAASPAVSFVMPVFNVERYLPKCLDSILGQTRSDLELVIVDDGSTDGSLPICRDYRRRDSRISVHTQENQGQGVARNRGVTAARGRYVCYVDPDDWLDGTMAEDLVPAMDASGADFGNFGIDFITEGGRTAHVLSRFDAAQLDGEAILHDAIIDRNIYSTPCNKIYTKSFLLDHDIRFPPTRAYEDIYYSRILSLHARKCIFFDKIYYHALIRPGSTTRKMSSSNILEAIRIIDLERARLIDHGSSALTRNLFDAHVIKLISGLLIQAAYRVDDWQDYMECNRLAASTNYLQISRDPAALAQLELKNQLMARVAQHPRLVRVLARTLQAFHIRPY